MISQPLIERSGLEAEGRKPCVGASALHGGLFRSPHQLGAEALAAKWLLQSERTYVQPRRPDSAEQPAENLSIIRP
jgi:hypothetical protein